jgi:hypothetical protein
LIEIATVGGAVTANEFCFYQKMFFVAAVALNGFLWSTKRVKKNMFLILH